LTGVEIAIIVAGSVLGGFVKGVTGMGYPLVAVPLITLALGIEGAVVVVAAPNLAANAYLCWHARDGRTEARDLGRLVGFGMVAAVVGTVALVALPEEPLLVALVVTIVAFIVQFVRTPHLRMDSATSRRWSPVAGAFAGAMQGAVGVSGPVVATWLHGYRLPTTAFVYSVTMIFGFTGAVQFVILAGSGAYDRDRLVGTAVASVAIAAMLPIGTALRARLGGRAFERVVLGVLAISAISLLVRVLA
jgi:uncharacterized membrane protein YfcA